MIYNMGLTIDDLVLDIYHVEKHIKISVFYHKYLCSNKSVLDCHEFWMCEGSQCKYTTLAL